MFEFKNYLPIGNSHHYDFVHSDFGYICPFTGRDLAIHKITLVHDANLRKFSIEVSEKNSKYFYNIYIPNNAKITPENIIEYNKLDFIKDFATTNTPFIRERTTPTLKIYFVKYQISAIDQT